MRRPDAMLLPSTVATVSDPRDRIKTIVDLVRATLTDGTRKQYVYSGKDGHLLMHFARLDPTETRGFPVGHSRRGEDRYEWFIGELGKDGIYAPVMPVPEAADDGHVLLGYLKTDDHAVDPDVVKAALKARMEEFKTTSEYQTMIERFKTPTKEGITLADEPKPEPAPAPAAE